MITSIPSEQICQAFDPMMILPEKTNYIIEDPSKANTSCFAPASVYLEGSRGKRFLCDYHYHYERGMTLMNTPELWSDIEQYVIDDRESIKDTFPDIQDGNTDISSFGKCWCGTDTTYVKAYDPVGGGTSYFCNFHYRKLFYRYLSNGRHMADDYVIIDKRKNMTKSIKEEAEGLTLI